MQEEKKSATNKVLSVDQGGVGLKFIINWTRVNIGFFRYVPGK